MRYVFIITLVLPFVINAQRAPRESEWSKDLYGGKNIGSMIKYRDKVYGMDRYNRAIKCFEPKNNKEIGFLEMKKVGKIGKEKFYLIASPIRLIERPTGIALIAEKMSGNKKIYGLFTLDTNLRKMSISSEILTEVKIGFGPDAFHGSEIAATSKDFIAICNYQIQKKIQYLIYTSSGSKAERTVRTKRSDPTKTGNLFLNGENFFAIQEWAKDSSFIYIYDGQTAEQTAIIDITDLLDFEGRIVSCRKLSDGHYIFGGYYGEFDDEGICKAKGLFKIVINPEGKIVRESTNTFDFTEIQSTQKLSLVYDVVISEEGNVFYVLIARDGYRPAAKAHEYNQLMVIGIHQDEVWHKSFPFRQAYTQTFFKNSLKPLVVQEYQGNLLLMFNDDHKNHKHFDHNNYTYSKKTVPNAFTFPTPDVCTILHVGKDGVTKPYMLDFHSHFAILRDAIVLDDGRIFATANGSLFNLKLLRIKLE